MYHRTRACTVIFIVVIVSCIAAVFARQQPKFRTGVEVVLIDVNVVDAQGHPVASLKAEDFAVSVDRKPRKIASAQFVDYGVRTTTERVPAPSPGAPVLDALAKPRAPASPSRNVLLVFDEDNLDLGSGISARKAAEGFLGRLGPDDRIGVATIPNPRSSITLTKNRAEVRKAIEALITGGAPRDNPTQYAVGLSEAFAVEQGDADAYQRIIARECYHDPAWQGASVANPPKGHADGLCLFEMPMVVRQMQLQARLRGQHAMDALRGLAEGLSKVAGPKTMVFISGGMPMPDLHSVTTLDRLGNAMASAQISLYTIYVERNQSLQQGAASGPPPTPAEDTALELAGAENVTGVSGGTLINASVFALERYFDRVATEISAVYLLGIEVSPEDRDGRPHAVQVKINRPNVTVRARKQYVIEPEKPVATKAANATTSPAPSLAAHAARILARTDPIVPNLDAVTPELQALLVRTGDFALDYEAHIDGLLAEELYDQTLAKWTSSPDARGGWFVERRRHTQSDYLLVRGSGPIPWQHFRDPFRVDGAEVRPRGRLAKLFDEKPAAALQQAVQIMTESARYNLGFGERNMDVPTLALVALEPANRARFFFQKDTENQIGGTPVWQVSFVETGTPTVFGGLLPLHGTLWIEPELGRVVRSIVCLEMDDADAEISVTYAPTSDLGGLWVPTEVRETYTSDTQKLETVARYANFRVIKK